MASPAAVAAIPAILAAMQFFGGLFGGDQERTSFNMPGSELVTPVARLKQLLKEIEDYSVQAKTYADTPVRLRSSFVQQPPVFTGGGLPMPIGLTGVDPALHDPSLLESTPFSFIKPPGEPTDTNSDPTSPNVPGDDYDENNPPALMPETGLQRRVKKPSDAAAAREAIQFLL